MALTVVRRLRKAGFKALFAGGCVRDMLLDRRCTDYDVATDATPRQVKRLFSHVLLIGAKFGVAMVIHDKRKVEVTTFRSDVSYSDGRRPDSVRFTTAKQDARRRDFTINGMFYDPLCDEIIDYVQGRRDIQRGVIRTIGNADERFSEDYLRMLRAVRFAVRFAFAIDNATVSAIRKFAPKIVTISGERIFDELTKMLAAQTAPDALGQLYDLGLAPVVFGELFDNSSNWPDAMKRVSAVAGRKDFILTLGALLAELSAVSIRKIVRRWGASNELSDGLCYLSKNLPLLSTASEMPLCDFKRMMAYGSNKKHFRRLIVLWRVQERLDTGKDTHTRRASRRANSIEPDQVSPPPFATGLHLKRMNLKQGPRFGKILNTVYDAQLNEKLTTRKQALAMARKMIENGNS